MLKIIPSRVLLPPRGNFGDVQAIFRLSEGFGGCYWRLFSLGRMLVILKYSRLPLL